MNDTNQEAEEQQITHLRNMSVSQRLANMKSLTEMVLYLSRRAILRRNPNFTKLELDLAFVSLHYGDNLAKKLKSALDKNE